MRNEDKNFPGGDLSRLLEAQRCVDRASDIYNDLFARHGSPNDVESEQEAFFASVADICKRIERLAGSVVYNEIFVRV